MPKKAAEHPRLKELNDLRAKLGYKPTIASADTSNMDERIETLKARLAGKVKAPKDPEADAKEENKKVKEASKKAKKKAVAEDEPDGSPDEPNVEKASKSKKVAANGDDGDVVSLAAICKRLELDARLARIKLRKAGDAVPATVGDSWRWHQKDVAAVEAIINE